MTSWPYYYYYEEAASNQSNASIEKPRRHWLLSVSYKNHNSECLPGLRPIRFYFSKSMCCVFESFTLVDMNLVASSNRQRTWVSVGPFTNGHPHIVKPPMQKFHMKAGAVSGWRFCLRAHRLSSSRGGLKSVQFLAETMCCSSAAAAL